MQLRRHPQEVTVKSFFYMGGNPKTKGGVSWKIWKIARHSRTITFVWGPALVQKRKILPVGTLHSRKRTFPTVQLARDHEAKRIKEQVRKGYEPTPRRRAS